MNENPITRNYLESFTTPDLIKMADSMGIDIPPELDRIFIIEDLLESASAEAIAENSSDSAESAESIIDPDQTKLYFGKSAVKKDPLSNKSEDVTGTLGKVFRNEDNAGNIESQETLSRDLDLIESVPLPKQYNITYIEVMIRDPLWAFVFWEIKAQDKEQIEKTSDFEGYYLKVSSWVASGDNMPERALDKIQEKTQDKIKIFTIPVKPEDTAWYLGIAPDIENKVSSPEQIQYKVELCADMKGEENIITSSEPFCLPVLYGFHAGKNMLDSGMFDNPLLKLSGYGELHILRYSERQLRAKKGAPVL